MGTNSFVVPIFEAIKNAGHEIVSVVTMPDKPKGRGKEMQMTPVKACAVKHNIEVFQPVKIKTPEAVEVLKGYAADLFVVAAFGQILSKEIFNLPFLKLSNLDFVNHKTKSVLFFLLTKRRHYIIKC